MSCPLVLPAAAAAGSDVLGDAAASALWLGDDFIYRSMPRST